jgi:hypothetical protein
MQLLAVNNCTAALTAIADGFILIGQDCFKIAPAHLVDFAAFRTAVVTQFGFGNDQMAMPASNFTVRVGHQPQYFVFAGVHSECGA